MAATTPLAQYPYPSGDDPVDVPADLERLAVALDNDPAIRRIYPDKATLDAKWAPVDGAHAFTTTELAEWQRTGGVWVGLDDSSPVPPTPNPGIARVTYSAVGVTVYAQYVSPIATVSDPNNIITQADAYAITIDKAGIYALNFAVSGTPGGGVNASVNSETNYILQSPGSTPLRTWKIHYAHAKANLLWTGRFSAKQSFRLALWGGQYGTMNAGITTLDIYAITLS